jgi:hypothetical protein
MSDFSSAGAKRPAHSKAPSGEAPVQEATKRRRPPPMRAVTKGWWKLEEQEIDIRQLEKEDRDNQKHA